MKKNPIVAAVLNFFLMGPGTLYVGKRKALGAALTAGAIGLTYVELSIQDTHQTLWAIMFASVFLMNTFFAIDGYREAKEVSGR
jgi:hypothetical protein